MSPGDVVEVQNVPAELSSFVATTKTSGNYFDFVAYLDDGKTISALTYSNKNVQQFVHSGDIGSLLHTITVNHNSKTEINFVLGAVGFRRVPLKSFSSQLPVVFLVNHQASTIYMVPCPLDVATIGNATLSGLVVGTKIGNTVKFCVLPAPLTVENVDTGDMSRATHDAVKEAISQAKGIFQRRARYNSSN